MILFYNQITSNQYYTLKNMGYKYTVYIRPVVIISFFYFLLSIFFIEVIIPKANIKYEQNKVAIKNNFLNLHIKPDSFNFLGNNYMLYSKPTQEKMALGKLFISDLSQNGSYSIILSENGDIIENKEHYNLLLEKGTRINHSYEDNKIIFLNFREYIDNVSLFKDNSPEINLSFKQMSISNILLQKEKLSKIYNKKIIMKYAYNKLFYCFIILLIPVVILCLYNKVSFVREKCNYTFLRAIVIIFFILYAGHYFSDFFIEQITLTIYLISLLLCIYISYLIFIFSEFTKKRI